MPRTNVKDKRKQQLINATIDSIAKRGLTETTITHISKGAGMSRGIINFYFNSKEMMMRDVLSSLLDDVEAIWKNAQAKADNTPKAQLNAIVSALFDRKVCSPKRLNVLSAFWGHAASHDVYRQRIDESDNELQQVFSDLWKAISPEGYSPEHFARQLHAMIRGLWLSYLMAPTTTERDGLAEECLAFIDQHLSPIQAVKPVEVVKKAPAKKKRSSEEQMDIEDLFGALG